MNYRDIGWVVVFLAAWVVLNRWVLPWFGVATCMSGGCGTTCCPTIREQSVSTSDRPGPSPADALLEQAEHQAEPTLPQEDRR